MPPRSLVEMCMRVALDNIHLITSLGNMPEHSIREILKGVRNAEQLRELELNSGDIYDLTAEHWQRLISKYYPILASKKKWVPSSPKYWYKVFYKYKTAKEEALAEASAKLTADLRQREQAQKANNTTLITFAQARQLPRLPRGDGGRGRGGAKAGATSWSAGPPLKSLSVIQKARRQARSEISRLKLSTPSGRLVVQPGQIKRAPEAMLRDKRIQRQFDPTATLVKTPRPKPTTPAMDAEEKERKNREARLLRIKNPGAASTSQPNVLHFDDEDEGGDADQDHGEASDGGLYELFDELENQAATPPLAESPPAESTYRDDSPPPSAKRKRDHDNLSSPDRFPTLTPAKRRRTGLLSAAPGSNSITRLPASPPTTINPFMQPNKRPHR
ncbi:hypothetical protein B0H67DRAFT_597036 [Lasiosphaeris hirsuta]|uniref:Elongin-A n=1 Tax=Lasiosphaeris hirsuta TaxID=260670 RepID=A0AA40BBD1_9PEZI|nr:hypothetical protein B0H67DRAFT_597036 [Lasiosphaeris hirsuta]